MENNTKINCFGWDNFTKSLISFDLTIKISDCSR